MKKILKYIPFHLLIVLVLGILTQFYARFWQFEYHYFIGVFITLTLLLTLLKNKVINTILSLMLFFCIGIASVYLNNDLNYKNHYKNALQTTNKTYLQVDKILKPSNYYDKYFVKIIQIDNKKTRGKVLLNVVKDSSYNPLNIDDIIFTKPTFKELTPALNPHQFDYKSYLKKQGVYQQLILSEKQFKKTAIVTFSLQGAAAKFRTKIQKSLLKYNFKPDELAIINALILGQRQDVSKELITDYANAGAIHILAVSGLHIGLILVILSFLLQPLERIKNGKILKVILIVLLLWSFAFIAGLSASVVRAVTMFTFLAIGQTFQQKKVTEFSLISSMFFLLLFNPIFLFDVGFQLSYLAVFGIVWVQPKLTSFYNPKNIILKKAWQLFTVSIAAQVGILPLSLYYFHQFPGLFLLSNLIILPCLGFVLAGGITVIFLSLINILPQWGADLYGFIISVMNGFINFISKQEQFLFKDISMSFMLMLLFYGVILFGIRFLLHNSLKKVSYFLIAIILLQIGFLFEKRQKNDREEFIVFHKTRKAILGKRNNEKLFIFQEKNTQLKEGYILKNYKIGEGIDSIFSLKTAKIFNFKNNTILLIDSLGIYSKRNLKNPIVILQYSPKINLERLINTVKPSLIIADGTNYKSYAKHYKTISEAQKTPFHYSGEKGFYMLK